MIDNDDLWPRDEEHRFRLYARRGETLKLLAATPTMAGIGTAIEELDRDAQADGGSINDEGVLGVLDVMAGAKGRWLVLPWQRGAK